MILETARSTVVKPIQLSSAEVNFYQKEGYLYIPGLIAQEDVAVLREEVLHIMEAIGVPREQLRRATGTADKLRQTGQYLENSRLDSLVNSPQLQAIVSQLLLGSSSLYLNFTAVKSGGGGGRFHFHQDNQYTKHDGPSINMWFALNPMTPENGCLQVVPRSHLKGTLESVTSSDNDGHRMVKYEPDDFLPVRMQPGDCIAFTRLTVHGSGPNTTEEPRVGYSCQFHRDDTKALWDGEWKLLKGANRWSTAPVKEFTRPQEAKRDGH